MMAAKAAKWRRATAQMQWQNAGERNVPGGAVLAQCAAAAGDGGVRCFVGRRALYGRRGAGCAGFANNPDIAAAAVNRVGTG